MYILLSNHISIHTRINNIILSRGKCITYCIYIGKRKTYVIRPMGCPAKLLCKYNDDSKKVEIVEVKTRHNHICSEEVWYNYTERQTQVYVSLFNFFNSS